MDRKQTRHLNGRVYDPLIGKFLSGDPFIGDPINGQNYNRYSYVLNNPMNNTDVTGFVKDPSSGCLSCDWTIIYGSLPGSTVIGMLAGMGPNGSNILIFADGHVGYGSVNLNGNVSGYQSASIAQVNAAIQTVVGSTPEALSSGGNKQSPGNVAPHCTDGIACVTIVGHREVESTPFRMPYGTSSQIFGDFFSPVASIARGMGASPREAMVADFAANMLMGGILKDSVSAGFRATVSAAEKLVLTRPTTVIGKVKDLESLAAGEQTLLDRLPDLGNPKANWAQNSGVLRSEMNLNLPIRDASVDSVTGELIQYPGSFLNAERNLLMDRGWTYSPSTTYWSPPQ